jgi:PKHD-type hydroxylase
MQDDSKVDNMQDDSKVDNMQDNSKVDNEFFFYKTRRILNQYYTKIPLVLHNFVSYDNVFTKEECNEIINYGNNYIEKYESEIEIKMKMSYLLPNKKYDFIYDRIRKLVIETNMNIWNYNLYDFGEPIKFLEYDEKYNSHLKVHNDIGNVRGWQSFRKLTIIVQLTDENTYDGCHLMIQNGDKLVTTNQNQGSIIIFPSFMMHQVTPITKGIRNSLVLWVYGPPFC